MAQQHVRLEGGFHFGAEARGAPEDELAGAGRVDGAAPAPLGLAVGHLAYVGQHVQQQLSPLGARSDRQLVQVGEQELPVGFADLRSDGAGGDVLHDDAHDPVCVVRPHRGLREQRSGVGGSAECGHRRVERAGRCSGVGRGELVVPHGLFA